MTIAASRRDLLALAAAAPILAAMAPPPFNAEEWLSQWLKEGHAASAPTQGGVALFYGGSQMKKRGGTDWAATDRLEAQLNNLNHRRAVRNLLESMA